MTLTEVKEKIKKKEFEAAWVFLHPKVKKSCFFAELYQCWHSPLIEVFR